MTVQLLYIATSVYCKFADNFFASINNLFPGSQKEIDVFTDNVEYFEQFKNDSFVHFNVHKIFQLPYPMINYMKFSYMKTVLDYNADVVIFADADSSFIEKDENFWNNLNNHFQSNKILINYHMMYYKIIHNEVYAPGQNPYYDILYLQSLHESQPEKLAYVPHSEFLWIQTCFCAAAPKEFYNFCIKLENLIADELKTSHYIPKLNEETYANKMLFDYYSGADTSLQLVPNLYVIESGILNFIRNVPYFCFIKKEANENIKRTVKDNLEKKEEI